MKTYCHFSPLIGASITPGGWLRHYLQRQLSGLTGRPEAAGFPFDRKWWGASLDSTEGGTEAWSRYEQTGYWIDGAYRCGVLLEDETLTGRVLEQIDYALEHADAIDGYIGHVDFKDNGRWSHAVFFRAILAHYQATGDTVLLEKLSRHYLEGTFSHENGRDICNLEILIDLYLLTGEQELLDLAQSSFEVFNEQYSEHEASVASLLSDVKPEGHGVTFCEMSKIPAVMYLATGKQMYLDAAVHGYAKLEREQVLADGVPSGAEHLKGNEPLDSHETCDIADYTWSLGSLLMASGDAHYADNIETACFNAAPGAITKDFKSLQYFSCPNQVVATSSSNHNLFFKGGNWMSYRPNPEVQCCTGNVNRIMPNYAWRMWMKPAEGGLAAVLYGPGSCKVDIDGSAVTVVQETAYPFEESIRFTVHCEKPTFFPFELRIPGWCSAPSLTLNGTPTREPLQTGTFVRLNKTFADGDVIELRLPMDVRTQRRPQNGVTVHYGPLLMSLQPDTALTEEAVDSTEKQRRDSLDVRYSAADTPMHHPDFPAWEMRATSPWNYALALKDGSIEATVLRPVEHRDAYPFSEPPLMLQVPAVRVDGWDLIKTNKTVQEAIVYRDGWCHVEREIEGTFEFTPQLPDAALLEKAAMKERETITLVPYGSTQLRLTIFPVVEARD